MVMAMVSQREWLDEGLEVLAANGLPGLRVETLARRLGVTKGSFYHHFVDLGDYRRALLGHYEQTCTLEHLEANAALDGLPALTRLERLADTVQHLETVHSGLELALRVWAAQDDDARQTLTRVDALRTTYIEGLLAETLGDPAAARDVARSIYYVHIGAQQAQPPATPEEVRRLYRGFLNQVAAASAGPTATTATGEPR
jgi:AcrR family transcriptional regulator